MCGIVGYVGTAGIGASVEHGGALDVVLEGLGRLEYRGYDSAGVALVTDGALSLRKKAGKLANLRGSIEEAPMLESLTGMGHTRWATHGGPTDENAHPHVGGDDGKLALVHNGIIENFAPLKAELLADGVEFVSETDTEVAAHLVAKAYAKVADLTEALRLVSNRLEGAFTLLVVHADKPGVVVGARRNSPLVVGLGEGENFLGSDVAAFIAHTREAIELGQDQIVTITPEGFEIIDFDGNASQGKPFTVTWDLTQAEKGGFRSFMAKEINDQPKAIGDTLLGRTGLDGELVLDELRIPPAQLAKVQRIVMVACGTAYYSALVAKYALEEWTRLPVEVELAHEFRYRNPVVDERTLVISESQSGETMDTVMAVKYAREHGAMTIAICNTHGSSIPRESDAVIYTHAGPEIAVASTKAFNAQIVAAYLLGLYLAGQLGTLSKEQITQILAEMDELPGKIQQVLDGLEEIREIARWMADSRSVLFLGRHVGYPVALEGALKLKEIAYIHAEGFAAGELKHGPIALIEPGQPVWVVVPSRRFDPTLHGKVVSNIQEVRARGANTLVIAEEGDEDVVAYASEVVRVPQTSTFLAPLLTSVPLQAFAEELATAKGYDVDQPRNLAKSVTVE